MKKTLSLMLVALVCATALFALVPTVKAEAATRYEITNDKNVTGEDILNEARKWANKGAVYWSGTSPWLASVYWRTGYTYQGRTSFDCSGFVGRVLNDVGYRSKSYKCSYGDCILKTKYGSNFIGISIEDLVNYGENINDAVQKAKDGDYSELRPGDVIGWTRSDVPAGSRHVIFYAGLNSQGKPTMIEFTGYGYYEREIPLKYQQSFMYGSRFILCDCEEKNDYADDGKCNSCGTYFDFESKKTDATGIYGTTKEISPSTTPYKATRDTSTTFKAGTAVEVIGKYKNAFDNTWYKISYGNGKTGYLFEENLKEVAPTILPSYVLAAATTQTEVMSLPCSTGTNSTSYKKAELKKNETFDVVQIVKNTAGNYWYKVKTAAGDEGWVWCEETKVKSFDSEPKSIIIGSDFPSTIPKAGRHVDYKVQTTYSNIKSVKGAIYSGTATSGTAVCSSTLDAGQKRYINLYGTSLDNALTFGSLTEGKQYTLVITANLVYGYYDYESDSLKSHEYPVSRAWTFTVKSSSSSSCSHTYDNACDTTCNKCGATRSTSHTYDNACDTSCNTCGAARSISHSYVSDCDTSCDVCGATRTAYCSSDNLVYTYFNDKKHIAECILCGKTFEALHYPGSVTQYNYYNSTQHWFYCIDCGENFEYSDHYYSNSTDETCNSCDYVRVINHTYDNACDPSCNVCGETRDVSHNYVFKNDEIDIYFGNHWQECTKCGLKINEGEHDWRIESIDEDYCGRYYCGVCYTDFILVHAYNSDCDPTCDTCGAIRTVSGHDYDNACDPSCNTCGATRSISHNYEYSDDAFYHWQECTICGEKTESELHQWELEETFDAIHSLRCEQCKTGKWESHKYDNACDKDCNVCEATRTTSHDYDNACDPSCNVCGATRTTNHKYSNPCDKNCDVCGATRSVPGHVYDHACDTSCNNCGYSRSTNHTYSNNCDASCNVCGATRSVSHTYTSRYSSDATSHWRMCTSCGHNGYVEDHIPGTPATETSPQRCIVCEFVIQEALGHTHQFGTDYEKDSQQHWHECSDKSCGAKTDIEDHVFGPGVVNREPTTTEKGEMLFTCEKCGAEKYEDIFVLPENPENPETPKDPETSEPPADSKPPETSVKPADKTNPWGVVIIVAVVGAVVVGGAIVTAAVVTVVIVVKKKSVKVKTNNSSDENNENAKTNNDSE